MTTPTKPAQKPKLPDKLRMVPPGRPPKGFRWLRRNEYVQTTDSCIFPDGRIQIVGPISGAYRIGGFQSDLGDNGEKIYGAFIRPVSQPKRAEKKRKSVTVLASEWVKKYPTSIVGSDYLRFAFKAGYRAANRRAKSLGLPVVPKAKKGRT